ELRIWDVALSARDVLAHFNGQPFQPSRLYINQSLAALSRMLLLIEKLQLSSTEIESVGTFADYYNFPAQFSDLTLPGITLLSVHTLFLFKQLTQAFHDTQDRLITYFARSKSSSTPFDLYDGLAAITGWKAHEVQEMVTHLPA